MTIAVRILLPISVSDFLGYMPRSGIIVTWKHGSSIFLFFEVPPCLFLQWLQKMYSPHRCASLYLHTMVSPKQHHRLILRDPWGGQEGSKAYTGFLHGPHTPGSSHHCVSRGVLGAGIQVARARPTMVMFKTWPSFPFSSLHSFLTVKLTISTVFRFTVQWC